MKNYCFSSGTTSHLLVLSQISDLETCKPSLSHPILVFMSITQTFRQLRAFTLDHLARLTELLILQKSHLSKLIQMLEMGQVWPIIRVGPGIRFVRVNGQTRSTPWVDIRDIFNITKPFPNEWKINARSWQLESKNPGI